jgi:hypothetical protein
MKEALPPYSRLLLLLLHVMPAAHAVALQEYERRWLHSNQSVHVAMPEGGIAGDGGRERKAVIKGLSASGVPLTSPTTIHCV